MRFFILFVGFIISVNIFADLHDERSKIEERISPIGKVRVQEDVSVPVESKAKEMESSETTEQAQAPGQKIYEQYCITCHKGGLAGAPKFRDSVDWKSRTANKNIDQLTAIAIKGINAMPPKGTCMECSEADIKDAIEYMLPKS